MTQDPEAEALFERLRDVVSGDTALRQLRRRYESLREEHASLLGRIAELESRIATRAQALEPQAGPPERTAPAADHETLADAVVSPLLRLREDYSGAAARIQTIIDGLDSLAGSASFKGQRAAGANPPRPEPVRFRAGEPPAAPRPGFEVDVKGADFGALLDFQERLSAIGGVSRVSIKAIDNERASLLVELGGEPHNFPDPHRTPT